jgi:hypothetical protein
MKYTIKAIFKILWLILLPMILFNIPVYLIGWLVTNDLNPTNWLLLTTSVGRFVLGVYEFVMLVFVPNFWEEFDML